jgi:tetratricopeptide (TPR) repeat protein
LSLLQRMKRFLQGTLGIFVLMTLFACSAPPKPTTMTSTDQIAITKPNPNRGWEGLALLLDKIAPDADTDVPLAGEEIDLQIEALINAGDVDKALEMIQARQVALASSTSPGTDVQLMFQHARALTLNGQTQEAKNIYIHLTERFPELIQPWNNLAVLYAKEGNTVKAEEALQTALLGNPNNANAKYNLAKIQQAVADAAKKKKQTPQRNPAKTQ